MKLIITLFLCLSSYSLAQIPDFNWVEVEHPIYNEGEINKGVSAFHIGRDGTLYFINQYGESPNYRSSDNGETWEGFTETEEWKSIYYLESLKDGRLIASISERLHISDDNGDSWEYLPIDLNIDFEFFISNIFIRDNGDLYIATIDTLYKSTDDGISWTRANGIRGNARAISNIGDVMYAGSFNTQNQENNKGDVYMSSDGGDNWEKTLIRDQWMEKVVMFDENTVTVAIRLPGGMAESVRTTNGGSSWQSAPPNDPVISFHQVNETTAIGSTARFGFIYTTNAGETWNSNMNGVNSFIGRYEHPIEVHPDGTVYMIDNFGKLWKSSVHIAPKDQTSINNKNEISVIVYPNPVNDYLNIDFNNKEFIQEISIIDINGNYLLNKRINSSINKYKIDLSNIISGKYYLVINYKNNQTESIPINTIK